MEEYTCIVCPNSCRITVSETKQGLEIHGNQCVRGADFASKEHTEPMRMFTLQYSWKEDGFGVCL